MSVVSMCKDLFQSLCRNYSWDSDSSKICSHGSLNSTENFYLVFKSYFVLSHRENYIFSVHTDMYLVYIIGHKGMK
jgi:hypothetical protein